MKPQPISQPNLPPLSMKSRLIHLRGYFLFSLALLYVCFVITEKIPASLVITLTWMTFIISLPFMSKLPRLLTIIMLTLGHVLFFIYGGDFQYWQDALFQSLPFVALFVSVPLLSIPLRVGGYIEFIVTLMHRFKERPVFMHGVASLCSFLLSCFMNLGSIRIMDDLFGKSFQHNQDRFVKAVMQGFSLSAMFSPYIAGVAIVLYLLEVPIISFLLLGIILILLGVAVSIILTYMDTRNSEEIHSKTDTVEGKADLRIGGQLLIAFIALFMTIILVDHFLQINLVIIISLIAFTFPFLWTILIKKQRQLPDQLNNYRKQVIPNVHNESVMIVSASFFAQMVRLTPFPDYLGEGFALINHFSLVLTLVLMLALILGLSVLGVHQILPITIFASPFFAEGIGLQPVLLALVLATGWGMSSLMAPISALNILSTQLFRLSWRQLVSWNVRFVCAVSLSVICTVYLLHFII
ncbi:hypothetical protein [Ammoniphilus resinae]|uniref:MFS family permease n=1 Tax=Ammoniphilus resinae TaxID=861532 RepID=A0ABS4GLW7_9BACL|nr:hypothetical protein [Ammoniphilus resinae]MBP1931249.1 MFS family permease [Ammoniphilus resinae]